MKGQNSAEPTTTCLKEGAINYDIFIVQHGLLPREYICVNKHLESPSGDLGWDEIPKVSFHKAYWDQPSNTLAPKKFLHGYHFAQ